MAALQCDHREPTVATMGGRRIGRRCTKKARYHASNIGSEGGGNFCQRHGTMRAAPGVRLRRLEELGRCACTGGDVPHGPAANHVTLNRYGEQKSHRRCTRQASVKLRRVITTAGKANTSSAAWHYCAACAEAIERYQGSQVERVA